MTANKGFLAIWRTKYKKWRSKIKRKRSRTKRMEFSKKLAIWSICIATVTAAFPYILAVFDKQPVSDLSGIIFTGCIGYLISYAGKSAFEKNSRNKYHLDENGHPFDAQEEHV